MKLVRIVKNCENCQKLLRLSKIVKIVRNCQDCWNWSKLSTLLKIIKIVKIVKNCQNCPNCPNGHKLSKIVKTLKNCQNSQKLPKLSKIVKTIKNCLTLSKLLKVVKNCQKLSKLSNKSVGQVMWSGHSVMSKVKVTDWVSESVTRSPIELLWTAKNYILSVVAWPHFIEWNSCAMCIGWDSIFLIQLSLIEYKPGIRVLRCLRSRIAKILLWIV